MTWRIAVDWLPDNDESRAEPLANGRICNLNEHPEGSALGSYHAYFEADEPPMTTFEPPYMPHDPRSSYHAVATAIVKDYPRFAGSVWDIVAVMLNEAGRGWPHREVAHGGLRLADIPTAVKHG